MSVLTPSSLTELRALLIESRSSNPKIKLSKAAANVLESLLDSPKQTAIYSISKLAQHTSVNPSTLSRLAQRLGYQGFSQFQDVFRQHLVGGGGFYSDHFNETSENEPVKQKYIALSNKIANDEGKNITQMLATLRESSLTKTVTLLSQASKIRVLGFRQSSALASFFIYGLGMLRLNVDLLSHPGHGVAHGMAHLQAGDVLVVFSSSPYTQSTINAAHIAASRGVDVIAFTDAITSPLVATTDNYFTAPTEGVFYSNSMASMFVLCETIMTLVAKYLGDSGLTAIKDHEKMIEALDIEFH